MAQLGRRRAATRGSARALAAAVRARRAKARDAVETAIERIERHDGAVNAVVVRDFERARAAADAIDRRIARGDPLGPLSGVPLTVKEAFDVAGLPTTWGVEAWRDNIAMRDATLVKRLRGAGAVILGKTNVPVRLGDWQTVNPIYGATNNPYALDRVPGGSSGGSAAAVAARFSYLEIGSDIGGSIRNPAHYCGVFGHKATMGLLPGLGHSPPRAFAEQDINAFGPFARHAGDLALAFRVLAAAANPSMRAGLARPTPAQRHARGWRLAVLADSPACSVAAAVREPLLALAERLRAAGAKVSETGPEFDHIEFHRLFIQLLRGATCDALDDRRFEAQWRDAARYASGELPERAPYDYYAWMVRGNAQSHREWLRANEARARLWQQWRAFFTRYDALLCPAAPSPAFPHMREGERWERMIEIDGVPQPSTQGMFWAGLGGAFGLPATVVPLARTREGLPVGVQIVGPNWGDRVTLALASLLERDFDCRYVPPRGFD